MWTDYPRRAKRTSLFAIRERELLAAQDYAPAAHAADVDRPVNQLGGRNSGFSSERRSVHPAAQANSSKNVMS